MATSFTFTDGLLASAPTGNTGLAQGNIYLYRDAIDHLQYLFQSGAQGAEMRDIQTAIQVAYRDIGQEHPWAVYNSLGRINLVAPYDTGTITYTHSTNTVTFSTALSSTAQGWARQGRIKIGNAIYPIRAYTSTTTVVLDDQYNPGADVAATSYTMFKDTFQLPANVLGVYQPHGESGFSSPSLITPSDKVWFERQSGTSGSAVRWTLIPDADRTGGFCIQVDPYPSSATTLDFMYLRAPRPIRLTGVEAYAGTVTNSASATAITGSGTAFAASQVGSFIRLSTDGTNEPTGYGGPYPYDDQRRIDSWTSTTVIGVTPAMDYAHTACKYLISDPIDVAPHMINAFLAGCEFRLASARGKDWKVALEKYKWELLRAKEVDRIVKTQRACGYQYSGGADYSVTELDSFWTSST